MKRICCLVLVLTTLLLCACGQESATGATNILAEYYNEGAALFNAGKYLEAAAKFEAAGDFENSKELVLQSRYAYAYQLYNAGDYQKAENAFRETGSYSDSTSMVKECRYRNAEKLFKQGDYTGARALLSELGGFKNSADLVKECDYQRAEQLYNKKSYTEARRIFSSLGTYRNSATFVSNIDKLLAPSPTPAQTRNLQPIQTQTSNEAASVPMVWIPNNGSADQKYHSKSSCSGMKNPIQIPLTEAQARYEPCGRCYR